MSRSLSIDWYSMCFESPVQLGENAISFVRRRGGPTGAPVADTGTTSSTPSVISAMCVPSGDQTGPSPTRESIVRFGTGRYHRSPPVPSASMLRIWFVPSRKRVENGLSAATATRLPSGDHVGIPGAKIPSSSVVVFPVARSTISMSLCRQIAFTSRYAMRVPSGDHAGAIAAFGSCVTLYSSPVFNLRTQISIRPPARSDAHASCDPSGDHAGSVSRNGLFVRLTGFPPIGMR